MAEQSKRFGRVPRLKRVLECSYFGEVDTDFSPYQLRIEALDGRVIGSGSLTLGYRLRDGQLSYSHGHIEVNRAFGGRGRREIEGLAGIGEGDVLQKFRGYDTRGLEDTPGGCGGALTGTVEGTLRLRRVQRESKPLAGRRNRGALRWP